MTGTAAGGPGGGKATVPTRRYDISITYDKYYQTPRVWMTGFNEHQQPLSVEELMEDVVSDYRHKVSGVEERVCADNSPFFSVIFLVSFGVLLYTVFYLVCACWC